MDTVILYVTGGCIKSPVYVILRSETTKNLMLNVQWFKILRPKRWTQDDKLLTFDTALVVTLFTFNIPLNEIWFYTPWKEHSSMPIHVSIQWRMNILAGYEGGTGTYINPMAPHLLRDITMEGMTKKRNLGGIASLWINQECSDPIKLLRY